MKAEYKRDMYNNYMIFNPCGNTKETSFGFKMLFHNKIPGFLKVEQRIVDNQIQYYYDITAKQPVQSLFQKGQLSKEQIIRTMKGILDTIDRAREYLLDENDFILSPEFIFMNLSGFEIELCYMPGYQKNINDQFRNLIEYIMDKVDYQEEAAVLFSYGLYKVIREKNCTLNLLREIVEERIEPYKDLQNEIKEESRKRDSEFSDSLTAAEDGELNVKEEVSRKDFIENTENDCVEEDTKKTVQNNKVIWFLAAATVGFSFLLLFIIVKSGLLMDSVNQKPDFMKSAGFLCIIAVVEGTVLNYLFDEEKKLPFQKAAGKTGKQKEVKKQNRRASQVAVKDLSKDIVSEYPSDDLKTGWDSDTVLAGWSDRTDKGEMYEEERTVVLGASEWAQGYKLEAVDKAVYEDILLIEFPFFIGKLKTKVDYSINSSAVSRFHAKLEKEGDCFYVADLNSTNGTYINGIQIECNERKLIHLEDELAFANVKYRFIKV